MKRQYQDQTALLVAVIPHVAKERCFALKGGTAINLFDRPMPRISVDIDLCYLGFETRETACSAINEALERLSVSIEKTGLEAVIQGRDLDRKLIVSNAKATIKIEPNYTVRGFVFPPESRSICASAEELFGFAQMPLVSRAELYGGKMCAALDRQHPRDLFDIARLFQEEEPVPFLMHGFVAMLLSHNRPPHELLSPKVKDQRNVFTKEFIGMTDQPFSYADHEKALAELVNYIGTQLYAFRELLLSFFALETNLPEIGIPNLDRLPAVQWKRQNLARLRDEDGRKFLNQSDMLNDFFRSIKE